MSNKPLILLFKCAAITGNLILIILVLYKEGFKLPIIGLVTLLIVTSLLLFIRSIKIVQEPLLRYAAAAGNILFLLFILFNGINEGFIAPLNEKIYYVTVMTMLAINSMLLIRINK